MKKEAYQNINWLRYKLVWYDTNKKARQKARLNKWIKQLKHLWIIIAIVVIIYTVTSLIYNFNAVTPVNAKEPSTSNLTIQEKIRLERKEVCSRLQRELRPELWIDDVNRCATVMTLNYAIESWFGKKAVRPNNKLGLKWYRPNWTYWFLTFESEYQARLYWAEKYYRFHYNKSMKTYIYWFLQKDWTRKWWYTATQKPMYYNFFMRRWNKIYGEIEDLTFNIQ